MADEAHSIRRHPMNEWLTPEEFAAIANDVQYCQISWPVSIERREPLETKDD